MKRINCLQYSRYEDTSYLWHSIKGYDWNGIARRGEWVSGKHSQNYKPVIITRLYNKRHPYLTCNVDTFEAFEQWLFYKPSWTCFSERIKCI